MALTKVTGHVVKPDTNIQFHNTKSTGIVTFTHTSNATSSTTGALQITGGVGIVKDLHVGGNVTVGGTLTYDDVTNIDSLGIITARGGINVSGGTLTVANDTDLNGNLDVAGISTLRGNVTIAGITTFSNVVTKFKANNGGNTHLQVLSTGSGEAGIFFDAANGDISGSDYIFIGQQNNLDFVIKANPNAGNIDFQRGTNTKVRIDTSGRLLIGTTTEGTVDSDDLTIATDGNTGMTIRSGTTHNGAIHFSRATSGVEEYAGYIDYDHNTNYFQMGTNASGTHGGRFLSADSDLVVTLGKPSFGGPSRTIIYGNAGGIRKNSLLVLNATASVTGRGAGVAVGGNTDPFGSFYGQKNGNADSAGGDVFLESIGDINFTGGGDMTTFSPPNPQVIIKSDGKFGVGTNSPGSLFQVGTDTSGKLTFDGANTLAITGPEGGAARIDFIADQGDDAADKWRITNTSGNLFKIQRTTSHTDAVSIDTSGNITFSANSNVNGALRVNTNRTLSTQFHVVGGTGSGTAYDAAVFAGGQNSTQGSGVRIHLTGCENDPLNRGTVIEGVMTDNSNGHALVFKTSPSAAVPVERLRILSNGNIRQQKDQSNPNFTLSRNASIGNDNQTIGVIDFASNTANTVKARIMAKNHGTNNVGGYLAVETRQEGGSLTEKLRITGIGDIYAGNADVGGYAIFDNSTTRPRYQFRQGTGTNRGTALIETRGDANSMTLYIAKSREGNGTGVINSGDTLGTIQFTGADGTNQVTGAQILAYTSGTIAADRIPTNLSFYTHPDSTAGKLERLRIDSSGRIGMANDSSSMPDPSTSHANADELTLGAATGSVRAGMTINSGANLDGSIHFGDPDSNLSGQINYDHNGDHMRFYTNSNIRLDLSDGGAIIRNTSGKMLDCRTTASTGSCWLQLSDNSGNQKGYFGFGSSSSEVLYIVQQESADIQIYTGSSTKWKFTTGGSFEPGANDSYDIGSSGNVVRNIYTGDLHLNNTSKEKGNDVDGTNGSWTIQEGQDDLYIINKLNGKKYRIPLEEVN